ncbi:Dihydroneopterin triphosphate diphosphatase [Trema orientale]|uniref:Dihydroneopterin triphosphate diphosphatase n=1 Tax=Trema orientale TaxID=63057 RepID=A0A2P5B6N8_TREOI|nr:Dihydroneopterin triphosphate diphosphatase [Trema orientale]
MACCCNNYLYLFRQIHHSITTSIASPSRAFPSCLTTTFRVCNAQSWSTKPNSRSMSESVSASASTGTFTWDDVVRSADLETIWDDPSDLNGYFEKIKICNRGADMRFDFIPFVIEDQIVGYVHKGFAEHLRKFQYVFEFLPDNGSRGARVTLNSSLKTPEDRTRAVGEVVKSLGEQLIPGIRNELYPVTSSFGARTFFSLERAAAPYFGIKAYGVHMNGYVEKGGQKFLWIGKRSRAKATYPGMLDHLVAGGLPHGIACGENMVKECEEEAGIPRSISSSAIPVGAVSYMDIDGYRYKRDVLFCYDLKLPESFIPKNEDGEVESFKLIPVTHVANVIRRTYLFKPNCCLVIIDFLFRHGYILPECFGYLDLLQSLRSGDCS